MRTTLLVTFIAAALSSVAWARPILPDAGAASLSLAGEVRGGDTLTFAAHVGRMEASELKTPQGRFTLLSIPGFQHSGVEGAPAIPVMNRLVEVPLGAKLEVSVLSADKRTYSLAELGITAPLFPRQPPQPKTGARPPFAYERRAYLARGMGYEAPVAVEELGLLRDRRLVLLKVAPIAYDPSAGTLEVLENLRIEMRLSGADRAATARLKAERSSPFFDFARGSVLVPGSLEAMTTPRPANFLIVSDRKFENDLKPFVDWKKLKGFQVAQAFTDQIGSTPEQIKSYVKGIYNSAAAPDFLLLVGDHEQIPGFKGTTGSLVTDLYYVTVTEGDNLPDILVGRFSARTSEELIPQIEKTLEYEKCQFADASYLERSVLTAGWDSSYAVEWGYPQINYAVQHFFNAEHGLPGTTKFLVTGPDQFESEIRTLVSSGCAFVNYAAHGSETSWSDPSFTIPQVGKLRNQGRYPFVLGNCCLTGSFQVSTCFGEAWLRAKNKGAIGYVGASSYSYWDEDLWWANGFYAIQHPNPEGLPPHPDETAQGAYDGLFVEGRATGAAMNLAGKLAVELSNSSRKLYYWEIYHLFGDPSLMVYLGVPREATAQHPAELASTASALEVRTIPGAYVGVTMNGELLGAGCADKAGAAALALKRPSSTGTATLVVTGQNLKPYVGTLQVTK